MRITFPQKSTWLHRANPTFKLALLMVMLFFILFIQDIVWMVYLTVFFTLTLCLFSGHPWRRLLLYSLPFLLIFISGASSLVLFGKGSMLWFEWGLIRIYAESFHLGMVIGFRALIFGLLGLIFALTTRPVYLFYSLMQQAKLPPKYAYSFMAAIRLFPTMLEEFQTIRYALKVRGMPKYTGFTGFYKKLKLFSIPLLAQSIRRAQRIAVAMEAKRFSMLGQRTYYYEMRFSRFDVWLLIYMAAVIGLAYYGANS